MRKTGTCAVSLLLAGIVACSSAKPVAIRAGDRGQLTRQPIRNVRIAAEVVPPGGLQAMKFRDVSAMAQYLEAHADASGTIFVTDYPTGRLIPVETAVFVKAPAAGPTADLEYYAFDDVKAAVSFGQKNEEATTDWPSIRARAEAGRY